MDKKKNKLNIIRDFYLISNLPIQALDYDGVNIGSYGHNERFNRLFSTHNVYDRIINKLKSKENIAREFINLTILPNIHYSASYIEANNPHSGIFVLGPYSCIKDNGLEIVYKPKCLMAYLVSLLRIISKEHLFRENIRCCEDNIYNLHVRRALDYINFRYMEDIKLSSIVDYLGINRSYFSSLFKKETGKTFSQYLNELRIHKSKYLLLHTNDSILDIALSVGFNNQNYYNISFKRIMKISPLQFRNQCLQETIKKQTRTIDIT